jgi:iron complex outermembrane recepter protein
MWGSLLFLLAASQATAQAERPASERDVTGLMKLSLDQLMDVEVTSVSKRPERLSETPSAIQVIQNAEIRRSGASRIPEALRLVSNLQVAQKNAHDWGISARGFNTELANKTRRFFPAFSGTRRTISSKTSIASK